MKSYLPDSIINRYKQPYRAPDIPSFFTDEKLDYVEDMLSPENILDAGYFDVTKVNLLLKKIKKGRAVGYKDNMALVSILSTQVWHQKFIKDFEKNIMQYTKNSHHTLNNNAKGATHVS
jgi:asparagine synthase (glutamine-hydrolysing)